MKRLLLPSRIARRRPQCFLLQGAMHALVVVAPIVPLARLGFISRAVPFEDVQTPDVSPSGAVLGFEFVGHNVGNE
jgi:hypothetical protein